MSVIEIKEKIVGQHVKAAAIEAPMVEEHQLSDIDPLSVRLDSRPVGELPAISKKISYHTQEGRKNLYLIISFATVEGRKDGKMVLVDRPIEFFIPNGQLSSDGQWITMAMRQLSLNARENGYNVAKGLIDARKVKWDRGLVRCGIKSNPMGKPIPMNHDSEVAAIAWEIQQSLFKYGFLDENGEVNPNSVKFIESITVDEFEPEPVEAAKEPVKAYGDQQGETSATKSSASKG